MIAWASVVAAGQGFSQPSIDAQLYRPAVDSRFLWVDEARLPSRGVYGAVVAHYTRDPLRWTTGPSFEPVVHDLAQADLVVGYGTGPVRFGLVAPVVARATGWAGPEAGLADLGLTGRGSLHLEPVELAVDARVWFPTSGLDAAISSRGLAGELALVASREFGRVSAAANLGYRVLPFVVVDDVRVDDAVTARLGGGFAVTEALGLTAELAGQAGVRGQAATMPVELVAGARYRAGAVGVHAGVGRGLTAALGTPSARALAAVTYAPAPRPDGDVDQDRILDASDDCVRLPEDRDGWKDTDGCPEDTHLTARVVDEAGAPLVHVQATLAGPGLSRTFVGSQELDLPPGTYTLYASDSGWLDATMTFSIADGPPQALDLILHPRRVVVTRERFEVDGEIHFESGSDRILSDSWGLLDEVAALLKATPEIRRMRIEGHTDSAGDDDANLDLSYRRALAVRSWVLSRGIEADRLTSVGYGESQPLVEGDGASAMAANRRVEFFVELWEEGAAVPQ
ncbi:MAG: OmpA family protein [Myxococcota bacterium]